MILVCALIALTDGDTFRAACPEPVKVRIANIDTPEVEECPVEAARATEALAGLLTGPVRVHPLYTDRYGRIVGIVVAQGRDVGKAMLDSGAARAWPHDMRGHALAPRPRGC